MVVVGSSGCICWIVAFVGLHFGFVVVLHLLDCVALVGLHLQICWKVAFVGLLMLVVVGCCGRL